MPIGFVIDLLCFRQESDELIARRAAQAYGEIKPSGKGWVWELHREGFPGLLREICGSSPVYLSQTQAWIGLTTEVWHAVKTAGKTTGGKVAK